MECSLCNRPNQVEHNYCFNCGEPLTKEAKQAKLRSRMPFWCWMELKKRGLNNGGIL
ncbi:MAG TPA: hypothetical protein PLZ08_10645 [Bacillota bacterium]|nr:hypothetical protein [Bacillota bacterium]HOL10728.1 hypothetical protein [Bacillota bacterium]HPO98396.1 hypothetical protein [Bacillota bacterium]